MKLALIALLAPAVAAGGEAAAMTENVHWLGHDSFRIDGPPVVYVDPFELPKGSAPADLILVTHEHFDHCSSKDVELVRQASTVVVAPAAAAAKLPAPVQVIAPGGEGAFAGVTVRAVPAYNIGKSYHPRRAGMVGYLFTVAGVTYYHAGDTDRIPEMDGLAPDVAFLPVSGTYVMTAREAAGAARAIKPRIAIPMHYGSIIGGARDAESFASLLEGSGIQVVVKGRE